jgi:homoserine kinase type II
MGRFTELSLAEARRLGAEFGVEIAEVEPLDAGSVNSNYRMVDPAGKPYFARVYEEQGVVGARAELELLRRLVDAGVRAVPALQRQSRDEPAEHRGKPFALYPWVAGESLCQARVLPEHCRAVGLALSRLHLASPGVGALSEGRFNVRDLEQRLERIERESVEYRADAVRIRERLGRYAALRDARIPSGIIHGDLFRDNVLWKDGEIVALIDFESASRGPFAYDLMVTVFAWCYGAGFEPELVDAMLSGYRSGRALEESEVDALVVEGALAALRFATTRITDFAMRAPPGERPARDFRRFVARLDALEQGVLSGAFDRLRTRGT